jgi:hypothetical protein
MEVIMKRNESKGPAQGNGKPMASLSNGVVTGDMVRELKHNVHGRFESASSKVSFPVVATSPRGTERCYQFPLDEVDGVFRPVRSVQWDEGREVLRAYTPGGTEMVGLKDRGVSFDYKRQELRYSGTIIPMSPKRGQKAKRDVKVFEEGKPLSYTVKQGQAHVIHQDVMLRSNTKKRRKPGQRQVMKCSAEDELTAFIEANKERLTLAAKQHLSNRDAMEWLHIVAFSLTNLKDNPQVRGNLGAARKQDNTRMMVVEKIPKLLSRYGDVSVELQGQFSMFPHTELVKDIAYEVSMHHGLTQLTVYQNTDVFSEYDYPRSTDQLIALVVEALLQGRACHVSELQQVKQESNGLTMQIDEESKEADLGDVMLWVDDESKIADCDSSGLEMEVDDGSVQKNPCKVELSSAHAFFQEGERQEDEERGHRYDLRHSH